MNTGIRHSLPLMLSAVTGVLCGNILDSILLVYGGIALTAVIYLFLARFRFLLGPILCFSISAFSAYLSNPVILQQNPEEVFNNQYIRNYGDLTDKSVVLCGRVLESVTTTNGERSLVSVSSLSSTKDYECRNVEALIFSPAHRTLCPGDEISVCGIFRPNSGNEAIQSPIELRIQSAQGPLFCIYSNENPKIIGHSGSILTWAQKVNERMSVYIDDTSLSRFSKGFIKGILLGNREGLTRTEKSVFADAGVSHILAVSGMHVGIICVLLMTLTLPLHLFRNGFVIRYCICGIAIWIYVVITGLSYSSVRAALMLTVVVMAILCGRKRSPISALFISVVFILVCDPHSLYNIGLWLSFTCVGAIISVTPSLNTIDISVHPRTHAVVSFLLTTLVATASTWMLAAYFFGTVPTHFLLANVVILPLLPLYVMSAVGYLLLYPLLRLSPLLESITSSVIDYPARILSEILHVAGRDAMSINVPLLSLIVYYIGILLLIVTLHKRHQTVIGNEYFSAENTFLPIDMEHRRRRNDFPKYIAGFGLIILSVLLIGYPVAL